MGWIREFFFSGDAASVVVLLLIMAVIWIIYVLRFNRE